MLDVEGKGHYVGCNLTVNHFQGSWWGEGNDMIFIDGEHPSIVGTELKTILTMLGHAAQRFPFFGTIVHEGDSGGLGILQISCYRSHSL